ncbi:MAG: hypothetical protein HFH82_12315 [Lachnospiraceae bacterium]|nr:hypothetical protein [Lachnospiraceae bacterium]
MKTEKIPMLAGIVLIILLAFLIVWKADIFGVSGSRLEQDARERQNVNYDWEQVQSINDDVCAMLFYDEDRKEYAYSIYLSREGLSYGYFYAEGGADSQMTEKVKGIVFEEKGIVLLSLNGDEICKVVIDNQNGKETILVDPQKPFAMILPVTCHEIVMYDEQDNVVTMYDTE